MKSDNAIWNGTKVFFVGIIVAIAPRLCAGAAAAAFCLLPAPSGNCMCCTICAATYRQSQEESKRHPAAPSLWVPDIEDEPLSDILLLHVNQRVTAALRTADSNITWEWATKDPLAIVKEGGRCLIRVHGLDGFESAEVVFGQAGSLAVRVDQHRAAAPKSHGRHA